MKLFLLSREDLSGFGPNSTNWTLYYFKIYDVVLHLTYQNFAFKNPNYLQRKQDKDLFFLLVSINYFVQLFNVESTTPWRSPFIQINV